MAINTRTSVNYSSFDQFNREILDLIDDLKEHKRTMADIVDEICTEDWVGRDSNEFRAKFENNLFPFLETYINGLNDILEKESGYIKEIKNASSNYN